MDSEGNAMFWWPQNINNSKGRTSTRKKKLTSTSIFSWIYHISTIKLSWKKIITNAICSFLTLSYPSKIYQKPQTPDAKICYFAGYILFTVPNRDLVAVRVYRSLMSDIIAQKVRNGEEEKPKSKPPKLVRTEPTEVEGYHVNWGWDISGRSFP